MMVGVCGRIHNNKDITRCVYRRLHQKEDMVEDVSSRQRALVDCVFIL